MGEYEPARFVRTILNGDGSGIGVYDPPVESWRQPRECAVCRTVFTPRFPAAKRQRFCGRSCSAQWRMRQPEVLSRVHAPDVAVRRGKAKARWFASGCEGAERERKRLADLCPTSDPAVRAKISKALRDRGHKPIVQGGNGRGMTEPQRRMLAVLGSPWVAEHAVSLGPRQAGYPTNYKLDLADVEARIGVELDGECHRSRAALDRKKDAKLADLGWTVLRFWNKDALGWMDAGCPRESDVGRTLAAHGIDWSGTETEAQ